MSHDTGNIDLRIRDADDEHEGHGGHGHEGQGDVDRQHEAEGDQGDASTAPGSAGAKVMYICTERMSELAREMSWPDCTRS